MMKQNAGIQLGMFAPSLEEIVPSDHFLRRLDRAVNFDFIYDELAPYYCANNGKYSTDPVVIVKSLLIGFLYGINSERRLEQELAYNAVYRWFLGLDFNERVPDGAPRLSVTAPFHSFAEGNLTMLICSKNCFHTY